MAPIYEYLCEECTNLDTCICTIDERNNPRECSRCGGLSNRIISTCADVKSFSSYSQKGSGEIRTRRQEARADKQSGRVNIRDLKWFKSFTKEYKDKQRQPSGQRTYETLGKGVK